MSTNPLPPINGPTTAATPKQLLKPGQAKDQISFQELLAQFNQDQNDSDQVVTDLVTGKTDNVQEVVMEVVKSEMSFRLFMEIRNQLIESYNELMRMQF